MLDPLTTMKGLAKLKSVLPGGVLSSINKVIADPIDAFRAHNLYNILKKADGKLTLQNDKIVLNPKIVMRISEQGSLEENQDLQDMWAGLIVSSTSADVNIHYIEILENLTYIQASLIKHVCLNNKLFLHKNGIIVPSEVQFITVSELKNVTNCEDLVALDIALDDLRRKDMIHGGFDANMLDADVIRIEITSLALYFFAAVSGRTDLGEFYNSQITKII